MKKQLQRAFTLIELMIVVAIIGVLAAVAVPFYRDYIIRAQLTEAYIMLGSSRISLREEYQEKGEWRVNVTSSGGPLNPILDGLPKMPTKYLRSIGAQVQDQKLVLKALMAATGVSPEIQSKYVLYGTPDGGVTWTCNTSSDLFHSLGGQVLAGTVDTKYLPANCR